MRLAERNFDVDLITPARLQLQLLPSSLHINFKHIVILLTDSHSLDGNNLIENRYQYLVLP